MDTSKGILSPLIYKCLHNQLTPGKYRDDRCLFDGYPDEYPEYKEFQKHQQASKAGKQLKQVPVWDKKMQHAGQKQAEIITANKTLQSFIYLINHQPCTEHYSFYIQIKISLFCNLS